MHNLEAGGTQFRVPLELGPGPGWVGVLDGPVGLTNSPVGGPQEVGPADHVNFAAHPDLQVRWGQPLLVEGDPRDRLEDGLRTGIAERHHAPGSLDAGPAPAGRYDRV